MADFSSLSRSQLHIRLNANLMRRISMIICASQLNPTVAGLNPLQEEQRLRTCARESAHWKQELRLCNIERARILLALEEDDRVRMCMAVMQRDLLHSYKVTVEINDQITRHLWAEGSTTDIRALLTELERLAGDQTRMEECVAKFHERNL